MLRKFVDSSGTKREDGRVGEQYRRRQPEPKL